MTVAAKNIVPEWIHIDSHFEKGQICVSALISSTIANPTKSFILYKNISNKFGEYQTKSPHCKQSFI